MDFLPDIILIESQWNLNKYYAGIGADGKIILIESQWNLNFNSKEGKNAQFQY